MNDEIQVTMEAIEESLGTLGKCLTVFHRNVKILHWNYKDHDFVVIHPWLDEVASCIDSCIDTTYEQLRKYKLNFDATHAALVDLPIAVVGSNKTFTHEETFQTLVSNLDTIRVLLDKNATLAESKKLYTYHDAMVQMNAKLDHIRYFVTNSL